MCSDRKPKKLQGTSCYGVTKAHRHSFPPWFMSIRANMCEASAFLNRKQELRLLGCGMLCASPAAKLGAASMGGAHLTRATTAALATSCPGGLHLNQRGVGQQESTARITGEKVQAPDGCTAREPGSKVRLTTEKTANDNCFKIPFTACGAISQHFP